MGEFYIFGAGEYYGDFPETGKDDIIIAADGGLNYLKNAGIEADIILGDFDSLGEAPEGERVIRLPVHKDDTDTGAAIKLGLSRGYSVFHIYGGTGGRLDHTLANISLLAYLASKGARGYLYGKDITITAVSNCDLVFPAEKRGTVSVFSYTEKTLVTLKGLEYELEEYELTSLYPLGVSNSFVGKEGVISTKDGILIVVYPT